MYLCTVFSLCSALWYVRSALRNIRSPLRNVETAVRNIKTDACSVEMPTGNAKYLQQYIMRQ